MWGQCGRGYLRAGCCAIALYASLTQAQGQRYNFRVFAESQGLTDLGINTLLQDRTGFVWAGTNNGLFRFDGRRFLRFGTAAGLPAHAVSSLFETRDGSLWVATEAGLSRRYEDRFISVDSAGAAPERGPETIAEDPVHHGIYLATSRGLLRILSSGGREWVPGTVGKTVWSVFTDRTGVTWYAQTSGICSISPSVTRCYGPDAGAPPDSWGGLVVDHGGEVWVRSAQRLISLAPGETMFHRRDQGLPYGVSIGALSLDASGNLLVPTGVGLALRSAGSRGKQAWTVMGADAGLVVPTVPWAMADREGLIWIAMRGGGIACWTGAGEWQNWTTHQGLKSDEIWAITRDRNGNLLAGTTYGVSILDHCRFRNVIEIRHQLVRDRVAAILPDGGNSLWIGTSPRGLFHYDKTTGGLRHFEERDGIAPETVYSLAASPDGSIWAGALKGLYRGIRGRNGWVFHKENTGAGHEAEYFNQVLVDRKGRLWAAGSEGLAMWESGVWTRIAAGGSPIGRLGGRLGEAPDGAIWFAGRSSSGLDRITPDGNSWRVESVSEPNEFGPQVTYFLGFDREGNLWRGTGLGVYALVRGHWIHYIRDDGLVWDDTNANAFFADADNSIWIGTTRGLSHHQPVTSGVPVSAPAEIVRVTSGTRIVDRPTEFRQPEGEGSISIEFAALTFRRPKAIRFRYRLVGIDATWIHTSDWGARYASIPPGKYTFEVESGAWDGGWFGQPARMSVAVVGLWWRSPWLAISLTAFGLTAILMFWRYREHKHRLRQRDLAVAVKQRTDELQIERTRERDSNAILEMIVANQPVGAVLDAIGNLICNQGGAEMCCVILGRGDTQTVAADSALPRAWRTALANPSVIPFEVWRSSLVSGFTSDPIWRPLAAALGEWAPRFIVSRLIGNSASPLGVVLMFHGTAPFTPSAETFDAPVRLARIAIEHATMYENLRRQARHDPLTGLPNRLRLEECLELAIRDCDASERKLAIFYIDLDGFKEINDTLSHRAGDLYLRQIAERMRAAVRSEDIVGRIGGDEFNVIAPMIPDRGVAEQIALRLLEEIRRPVTIDGVEFSGTASLGIAIYPDDATAADDLQRKADAAMYCAKSAGKNRFECCDSAAALTGPHGMDHEIRSALAENRFRLDYQPKVNAAGQIAGIEALARLEHPTLGEILPARFIAVAEQTGLIVPVGMWVLSEVCRQIADWSRRGVPVAPVAVNVSPVQLCRDDFAATVQETLDLHEVDPGLLELEVTESVLVDKSDVARRQMQALRRVGVRFSIDDFGAGYSSFSYLHQLDVDAIQLDRSFVHSIETDASARKLVQAIIGMTERMGIRVIAEGVETETQRSLLLAAGCELMQGYFFARPQPAHRLEALLLDADRLEGGILQLNRAVELAGTS
jgi:diguanylate cyclase (GGDEF)-like protein